MTEKNKSRKKKESKKIEIQTRTPTRPGIFDNIATNRSYDRHPLKDILNFPTPLQISSDTPSTDSDQSRPLSVSVDGFVLDNSPSTLTENGRQSVSDLPSTNQISERPQNEVLPSTRRDVDGLPSTLPETPSTSEPSDTVMDGKPSTAPERAVHTEAKLPSAKADRHNKFLARYDNRVNPAIKQRIDIFCATFDLSQREFAEQSAVHFIDVWTAKFGKNVDGKTALDDRGKMIMYKSKPALINLYRIYNSENKWKFKDDEVGVKYAEMDLRIIELGIIETQFNSNFKKINSFGYYQNEIENFKEQKLGEEMLVFLINHYRKKWTSVTGREVDYRLFEAE